MKSFKDFLKEVADNTPHAQQFDHLDCGTDKCCGTCQDEDILWEEVLEESEYQGKKVTLNKPFRASGGKKKFYVYVKNDKNNVIKLGFGDPNMEIKRDDPDRRRSYRARHGCDNPGPKWKANYWSCKMWSAKPVSKIT